MSTISASTTSTTAYKVTADTTGTLVLQTGSSPTTAVTIGSDQKVTFAYPPTATGAGSVATNTAYGSGALAVNTTGSYNTAIGNNAMVSNLGGTGNNSFGAAALYANTSGNENTALGGSSATYAALRFNTSGSYNVAIGGGTLVSNTTASNNTAVGYQAGYTNITGAGNLFVGTQAGYNSTGSFNTFVGTINSGSSACGGAITTGSKNTILGGYTGNNGGLDIRTASNYIVLSDGDGNPRGIFSGAGDFLVGDSAYTYAGGAKATFQQNSANRTLSVISNFSGDGTTHAQAIQKYANDATTAQRYVVFLYNQGGSGGGQINGNGASQAAFGSFSDERLKENIVDLQPQLANIMALRPVEFDYKTGGHQTGFIAQEMQQVFPEAVAEDGTEDQYLTVTGWNKTEAILVKAIQELKAELDAAKADIATLKGAA